MEAPTIIETNTPKGCDTSGAPTVELPPIMSIETVESLAAEFKQLPLAEKTTLTLDASLVETITTPGIQLIVSLEKTLASHGGTFVIQNPREGFTRAFKDAGLEGLLTKSS